MVMRTGKGASVAAFAAGGDTARGGDGADGSGSMFDAIADRYDLVNRVLSLGMDRAWRARSVAALELGVGARVLDLATGTADVALEVARQCESSVIVGVDPSPRMLELGRRKIDRAVLSQRIELREGDAERLPFADASFDGAAMAFGIRNVRDRRQALLEIARVLKPGARISILELTEPRGLLRSVTGFYVHRLVPRLGGLLSRREEYRYLERSIAAFPRAEDFTATMRSCGLEQVRALPLSFGVCHLFVGARPKGAEAIR